MDNIILEIGKTYESKTGRLIKITEGYPPINGKRDGWNGVYWGSSVDDKTPKINNQRYTFEGIWWDYISQFSSFGYKELSNPNNNLIKEINI